MEKVDILEMAVGYLRDLRRASLPPSGPSHPVSSRYIEGYNECAVQVGSYLESAGALREDACQQLRVHLLSSPAVLPSVQKPLAWGGECDEDGSGGDGGSLTAALSGTVATRDRGSLSLPATVATQIYLTSPAITTGLSAAHRMIVPRSFPVPVLTSSALLVVAAAAAATGSPYGLLGGSGSPRQGDECPCPTSAVFSAETDARVSTNAVTPKAENSTLPRPLNDESTVDERGGQVLPGSHQRESQTTPVSVWRPWNGQKR